MEWQHRFAGERAQLDSRRAGCQRTWPGMDLSSHNLAMQAPVASEGAVQLDVVLSYIKQQQDGILVCPVIELTEPWLTIVINPDFIHVPDHRFLGLLFDVVRTLPR
jgi:hypothetical protein